MKSVLMGLLACLLGVIMPVAAQSPTIITMTAPQYLESVFKDTIIPEFEAQHPGIQVQFVYADEMYSDPFYDDEANFAERLTEYASAADVLYVSSYNYSSYMTSTGFFLDLTPLVSVDGDLMPDDFYPAAWDAFQWDGGIWAMPTAIETQILVYNQDMFDAIGLPYPNESWSISDFIQAGEALHTYNDAGEVELSSLSSLDPRLLLYSSIGDLVDDSVIPNVPDFSHPELADLLNQWATYWSSYEFAENNMYSPDEMAMYIGYPYQLAYNENDVNWQVSLLPGGIAGSSVEGYAISQGTAYPEAAYELVNFLSYNTDIFEYSFGSNPVRRSVTLDSEENDAARVFGNGFTPEVTAFLADALEHAVSPAALRFTDMVYRVNGGEVTKTIDQILEEYEAQVNEVIGRSVMLQSTQILVNPPVIRPELAPGETVLTFGYDGFYMQGARDLWSGIVEEFIAAHPNVIDIELESDIYAREGGINPKLDCYATSNVNFSAGTQGMLPLDPLLNTDFDFSPNNFLPGVLEMAQFDGLTYGYPLTIEPLMMWINEAKFEEAGIPVPEGSWTVNEFNQAIVALGNLRDDPEQAIVRNDFYGATGLMMLSAAYGGIPVDYGADPAIYNLTDPQVLNALGQLISYIRDENLISYQSLFALGGGGGYSLDEEYIVIDSMGAYGIFTAMGDENTNRPVMFPLGDLIPVYYQPLAAVITDTSLNVDECYEWIKMLRNHPDLFYGMPADVSLLDSPELGSTYSDEVMTFYRDLASAWSQPNVVPMLGINGSFNSQSSWLEGYFFYYALDNVILHDAELEPEMAQAQTNISLFRECVAGIEEISEGDLIALATEDEQAALNYYRQFIDCAVDVLPAMREQFSYFYQ